MANKNVFQSTSSQLAPAADTLNAAGGLAYKLSPKETLAQLVMTGTFNNTFYTSATDQTKMILDCLAQLSDSENSEFVAKLAVHARKEGFMKDTPALLLAWLSKHNLSAFKRVFTEVVDNGKMLRNFVQIMRSGVIGRKSLGSAPKNLINQWIQNANFHQLIQASVGTSPSLADILKMTHPKPTCETMSAFFDWVISKKVNLETQEHLPPEIKKLLLFRERMTSEVPAVPFELLTSSELSVFQWRNIALQSGWQMIRMNLNTFLRKGIFNDAEIHPFTRQTFSDMETKLAARLRNREEIARARVMPYQLFTTYLNLDAGVPVAIREALADAMEYSIQNVPKFKGKVLVFVDVSGSMDSSITGERRGATSKMRCIDVAALIGVSILRANPSATVKLFDTKVHNAELNPQESIFENAKFIASYDGGGTATQVCLQEANRNKVQADLVIYVSDNESWFSTSKHVATRYGLARNSATETAEAWSQFKERNPKAKLVCINLQPSDNSQVQSNKEILNVGGFNDSVYRVIEQFLKSDDSENYWVNLIES